MPRGDERQVRTVAGREFEEALDRAEALLRQADDWRLVIARYRVVDMLVKAVAGLFIVALLLLDAVDPSIRLVAALIVVAGSAVATLTIDARMSGPLRALVRRDEQYAAEVINLLRELLPFVARDEQWSRFQTEQVRLRFERFPIRGGGA